MTKPSHHVLKCWPEYFNAVLQGRKTFEVRENDRNYQEGDTLELREFKPCKTCSGSGRMRDKGDEIACNQCGPEHGEYTWRQLLFEVSYVMKGGSFGVSQTHVVMGIKKIWTSWPTHTGQQFVSLGKDVWVGSVDVGYTDAQHGTKLTIWKGGAIHTVWSAHPHGFRFQQIAWPSIPKIPKGLGVITECPVCKSKDLKDESGFIIEGVSCRACGWADIDAGIDSGC